MAIGRISGPLLKANLLREGVNLAFETDLLYLDVVNGRIGINTAAPTHDLTVDGTTRTTTLEVLTQIDIGPTLTPNITINGSTITGNTGTLNLAVPSGNQVIYQAKLSVDNITLENNVISTNLADTNLEVRPNGIGEVLVYGNTTVYGDIHATGNVTADGDITIGDSNTDFIEINADIASDIIPNLTDTYTLGTNVASPGFPDGKRWKDVWTQNLYSDNIITGDITVDNINLNLRQGNIWYVATNGKDTYSGDHQNDPFGTVKHALSVAQSGDTVYVYPGEYYEHFPLEVPNGVTVRGESLRAVTLRPHPATMWQDAFHMNGEATVEDFTLMGFYHDPNGTSTEYPLGAATGGTGHGFRFSNGVLTTTRSPYVRNVTVITYGTPSVLSINSIKSQAITGINRIKGTISNIVQNINISPSVGNIKTQNISLPTSDGATGALLEGLIDNIVYVINNGTQRASLPAFTENGLPVTAGALYNAAVIIEANRGFIKDEVDAYVAATYGPGFVYDHDKTKRDAGYILDALITDIKASGNEYSILTGFNFWQRPVNDPRGYDRGDAGHGAFVDGTIANAASKEAAMLFHSVTFLTPAAETLIAQGGARVEWLNSFTYFADKGMYLTSTATGFAGQGKTRLKIPTRSSTWTAGDTVQYYDTDGTTVLASGTIASVDGDWINLTGRQIGFAIPADRPGKTITVHGGAHLVSAVKKFGSASLALDGAGDYLSLASSTDFAFGTDPFCVELWVYRTGDDGTTQILADFRASSPQVVPVLLLYPATYVPVLNVNGTNVISGTTSVPLNTWTHIAVAKTGTSTKIFMNGSQEGSTYTDNNDYIQGPLTIGARFDGTTPFYGYLDDVRISKGVARYTSNFTAPTAALLGDSSAVLLLHLNGLDGSTAITDDGVTFVDIRNATSGGLSTDLAVADYSDFGAEVRSIGSACVYGNYGVYGDGPGVIAYLIGQNLAYIGNGKSDTNDTSTVIQANEVVELNGAKIYYNSVDHKGDFRVGDLFYVNQQTGEVTFSNSNIEIGTSLTFDDGLGNVTFIDANKIETGDFRISGNTIETLTQDFNVLAANNQINLQNNVNIAGNLDVVGDVTIGGNIIIGDQSTDLVTFVAAINSDIIPNLNSNFSLGNTDYEWKYLYTTELIAGSVDITANTITTNVAATDLILSANGTGRIYVPSNNVEISQNLTVDGTTNLKVTNIGSVGVPATITHIGDVQHTGNITQTGDITVTGTYTTTGTAQFTDIKISTNEITTTIGNNDLRLLAAGTGRIYVPTNDVQIDQNLTVNGTLHTNALDVTTTITANQFSTGDINIDDNIIKTTLSNNDLILQAAGTGRIYVPADPVQFDQNLTVNGTTNLKTTGITGTITHVGDYNQTGNVTQTGNTGITGTLTVGSTSQFQDIKIDNNVITTTLLNNDLTLTAAGTGRVYIPDDAVQFNQTLTVTGLTSTSNIQNTGTVTSNVFTTGDINIDDNIIKTTLTNSNLVLQANGSGIVSVPNNNVQLDKNLTVAGTTTLSTTNIGTALVPVTVTHVGTLTHTGDTGQTGNFTLNGILTVNNTAQFKDIKIDNNVITTTIDNHDLELTAAGTGRIYVPQNDVRIAQNLTVIGTTTSATINNSGTITSGTFSTGNITVNGNTIQTTVTNSNLQLQASGTGLVEVEQLQVQENEIRTVNNTDIVVAPNGTGIVNINSNQSIKIPVGTTLERPNPAAAGMVRFNTTLSRYEGFDGSNWIRLDGLYDLDENTYVTAELTHGANDNTFRFVSNGVQIADLTAVRLNAEQLQVDSININANIISTTTTDTDISLQTTGTGAVKFQNFAVVNNVITNTVSNSNTLIAQTGTGYFKIGDTNGFVIPVGTNEQRPTLANTELGMMRFNTSDLRVEVWDGIQWISAAGSAGAITVADAEDISILSVLMLG